MLSKRNRDRLLSFARWLDRRAAGVRRYVRDQTPKRERRETEAVPQA